MESHWKVRFVLEEENSGFDEVDEPLGRLRAWSGRRMAVLGWDDSRRMHRREGLGGMLRRER